MSAVSVSNAEADIFPSSQVRRRMVVAGLVLIPLVLDLLTTRVNLPILFSIALLVAAQGGDRRLVRRIAIPLALLVFAGYVFEFRDVLFTEPQRMLSYRLLNRTLVAIAILLMAGLLSLQLQFRERVEQGWPAHRRDKGREEFEEILRSIEGLVAVLIAAMLILCVMLADLLVPGQFNLPILYALPLVVAAWSLSRTLLWSLVLILLMLSSIGFAYGRAPTTQVVGMEILLTNRTLALFAIVGIGLALHFWIGRVSPSRSNGASALASEGST
jgi:hypothetical protein